MEKMEKDVHTEHCCKRHGCKYGNLDCTVAHGNKIQSYDCEACGYEYSDENSEFRMIKWLSDKGYLTDNWDKIYKDYLGIDPSKF
jgi:hypothetical protein